MILKQNLYFYLWLFALCYALNSCVFYRFYLQLHAKILQVEAYRDMITPVVDAFKYLTQVVAIILSKYCAYFLCFIVIIA